MTPLSELEPDLRLAGEGRLVEFVAKDGTPLLRQIEDEAGNRLEFRMMAGFDGEEWQLVR